MLLANLIFEQHSSKLATLIRSNKITKSKVSDLTYMHTKLEKWRNDKIISKNEYMSMADELDIDIGQTASGYKILKDKERK